MTKLKNREFKVGEYIDSVILASNTLLSLIYCTCFFLDSLKEMNTGKKWAEECDFQQFDMCRLRWAAAASF